jgi:hypothetical protein
MQVLDGDLTIGRLVASVASALQQAQQVAASLYLRPGNTGYRSKPIFITRGSFEIPLAFVGEPEIARAENMPRIPDITSSRLPIVISANALKQYDADQIVVLHLAFEYADEGFMLASSTFTAGMN